MVETYLLVAGEASGDLHGARVIESLRARVPDARFVGMGGPRMVAAGLEPLFDASELSVMGFVEVLPKVGRILSILSALGAWAEAHRPAAAVLIDVPDFNLRLARVLQELGVPVGYYVAPMAWAWRESRVRTLRQRVDRLFCIYPFEEAWFRARGVDARYVGNPLLEDPRIARPPGREECRARLGLGAHERVAALLPGSRRSELERVLPTLLLAGDALAARGVRLVLPVASGLDPAAVEPFLEGHARPLLCDAAVDAVGACDAAAVCSGTATLETALLERPMVVVYRSSPSSFRIAKALVNLSHASIVNILAGREIVPELLQDDFTAEALVERLLPLLEGGPARDAMLSELRALRRGLGEPGASDRVAGELLRVVEERRRLLAPAPAR